jgi:hypothetical protein
MLGIRRAAAIAEEQNFPAPNYAIMAKIENFEKLAL